MLQFHKWDEVLALPKPADEHSQRYQLWHYAQAMALAAKGRADEAQSARDVYAKLVAAIPADVPFGTTNTAQEALGVGVAVADAAIAEARGASNAVDLWRQAVEAEDKLNYDEPPAWYYPVRQSLGAALLKAGKFAEAERVFRETLEAHPRDGRLLFGLHEALVGQKKSAAAAQVRVQFEDAWKSAERKLQVGDL